MVGRTFWLKERINGVISSEFLGPLLILPPIVFCGALSSLATVLVGTLIFMFVLSASVCVILTAHLGLISPVDLFGDQIPRGLKVFLSVCSPSYLHGIMLVTSLLWYVTLMVPVNIEEKLTVMEIVFYHLLLCVVYRLWRRWKSVLQDGMLHLDLTAPLAKNKSYSDCRKSSVYEENLTATADTPPLIIPIDEPSRLCSSLSPCVDTGNVSWFMGLLSVHLFYAMYTANLALTSVCTPLMYLDWFILPNDCSTVYATLHYWLSYNLCPFPLRDSLLIFFYLGPQQFPYGHALLLYDGGPRGGMRFLLGIRPSFAVKQELWESHTKWWLMGMSVAVVAIGYFLFVVFFRRIFSRSWVFVASIYWLISAILPALLLLYQMFVCIKRWRVIRFT